MFVQTGLREVFFANVKLGNNINEITKAKKIKSGQGWVALNDYHIKTVYGFPFYSFSSFAFISYKLLVINVYYKIFCSLSTPFMFFIFYKYDALLNILIFKNKSKKLNNIEIQK